MPIVKKTDEEGNPLDRRIRDQYGFTDEDRLKIRYMSSRGVPHARIAQVRKVEVWVIDLIVGGTGKPDVGPKIVIKAGFEWPPIQIYSRNQVALDLIEGRAVRTPETIFDMPTYQWMCKRCESITNHTGGVCHECKKGE